MTRSVSFLENSLITFLTAVFNLILNIFVSVIIARLLGPEGKGAYTLTTLFSYLIVVLGNLGFPSAVAFYAAKRPYACQEILGSTVLASLLMATLGVIAGLIIIILAGQYIFPGIPYSYLLLSLLIIPGNMVLIHLQYFLLGSQYIKEYNLVTIIQNLILFALIIFFLWCLGLGVTAALVATIASWTFTSIFALNQAVKINKGITLKINFSHFKEFLKYGLRIHISNILRFLSLRINLFLVNGFLNLAAVGFYSVSIGLVEKLWLIPQSTATVLFPKIAGEKDEVKKREFTPIVARTILWIMILIALAIFPLSQSLITLFYSHMFLPATNPFRILLLGTIAVGVSQILGNDIAGRGLPALNMYANIVGFISIAILSVLWIPRYGIEGAAWASTTSYILSSITVILLYSRISGNSLRTIIFPKRADWTLYQQIGDILWQRMGKKIKTIKVARNLD